MGSRGPGAEKPGDVRIKTKSKDFMDLRIWRGE